MTTALCLPSITDADDGISIVYKLVHISRSNCSFLLIVEDIGLGLKLNTQFSFQLICETVLNAKYIAVGSSRQQSLPILRPMLLHAVKLAMNFERSRDMLYSRTDFGKVAWQEDVSTCAAFLIA